LFYNTSIGGKVAERKVKGLLEAGAKVKVIAPEVTPNLEKLASQGRIELLKRPFQRGDLEGAWLVFAATNDSATQEAVFAEAEERHIFCNVVDKPELCSFIVPSVVKRGRLQLAISTSGASPAVARRLREHLEELFGPEYEEFLELMARWREIILSRDLREEERREIFEHLALAPIPQWLKRGERTHLRAIARAYDLPDEG
jgi:precorrin-2 dehydrogenase/sirohydrochlorin ferrochelatase